MSETSTPMGAWVVKLKIMTDQPTDRQADIRAQREVSLTTRAPIGSMELKLPALVGN